MASRKNVYFTDEMEECLKIINPDGNLKVGHIVRSALLALIKINGQVAPAPKPPKSVFADMDMNIFNDVLKRLDALEASNDGSEPKRIKILQDVEDIEKV